MKNILSIITVLSSLLFISCAGNNDKDYTPAGTSAETESTVQPMSPAAAEMPAQNPSMNSTPIGSGAVTTPSSPANSGALNPAHGEPGHDCAVAVGAPLSSKTSSATTPPATQNAPGQMTIDPSKTFQQGTTQISTSPSSPTISPSATPSQSTPAVSGEKTVTAAGMNPPHGEPGHDCAVAVGAPLKK